MCHALMCSPFPSVSLLSLHPHSPRREFECFGGLRSVFNAVRAGDPGDYQIKCADPIYGSAITANPSWTPPQLRDCELVFVAFDILQADGTDLSVLPLLRRYEALRAAVRDAPEEGEPGFVVASGPECRQLWGASNDANSLIAVDLYCLHRHAAAARGELRSRAHHPAAAGDVLLRHRAAVPGGADPGRRAGGPG